MIPELGQFALILALLLAVVQCVLPILGAQLGNRALIAVARPAVAGQAVFVVLAFAILAYAFVTQDFSVAYVAQNSNSLLPWYYRLTAVWGAHEGSMLLWVLVLNLWTVAVAAFSRRLPDDFIARVLGVLGFISFGFLLFMLPNLKLSMFPQVVVGARVSKSGNALPQSGDLQVLSAPIDVRRAEPIVLTIDQIVP